jgi:hypothetical protein
LPTNDKTSVSLLRFRAPLQVGSHVKFKVGDLAGTGLFGRFL